MGLPKGRTNNPNGRPNKGTSITDYLKGEAEIMITAPDGRQMTKAEALAKIIWEKAVTEQDQTAMKLLINYTDGLPLQKIEHSGSLENPLLKTLEETEGVDADNVSVSTDVVDDVKPNE